MLISDIIPYERNARHNEKAVPVVAESIERFGFKGSIVLRSREDPTIVNGHTRVAACKLLGWKEFPDENIVYADDLTDEEVRALRLADNRTGEIATWNKTLLQHEMRSIKSLDMSKFRFDFKSKQSGFKYGQERLKTTKAYNLDIVNVEHCDGVEGYPKFDRVNASPTDMISFNFCKTATEFNGIGVHFCIDDYQFERVWNQPQRYLELLRKFDCVVCPDFSVYLDMPLPMKRWNIYRSRSLGNWWQREGLTVIPNVTWSGRDTFDICTDGIPKYSTIFVSTVGVQSDELSSDLTKWGLRRVMAKLRPSRVLLLGGDLGFDFGNVEVKRYKTSSFRS